MTCTACSAHVEHAVAGVDGVCEVHVNLLGESMTVAYDSARTTSTAITDAVTAAGYGAGPFVRRTDDGTAYKKMKRRLAVSLVFMIPLFYVAMGHMLGAPLPRAITDNAAVFALLQFVLCVPVIIANRTFFIRGFRALFSGTPNMDSLIAIGSTAAFVYSVVLTGMILLDPPAHAPHLYYESAAMILTLVFLGKTLEERATGKTKSAVSALLDLSPKTATVLRDGKEVEIPTEQIELGETVVLRAGERIPVDGELLSGALSVDESAVTGESLPVDKQTSDSLISGTVVGGGYGTMRAARVGEDTSIAEIVRLIEEASAEKVPAAKLADRISRVFVPVVISISLLSFLIWMLAGAELSFAIAIAIAVLVISCPCALGLATPTAIMVATGRAASLGIMLRRGEALQTARTADTVVLDKTGTVTSGEMNVTDVASGETDALFDVLCALESRSDHPIAHAILRHVGDRTGRTAISFESAPYGGITGTLKDENGVERTAAAGNGALMGSLGIDLSPYAEAADRLKTQGKTVIYAAEGGRLLGVVAIADTVRPTSAEAVARLKKAGAEVILLTGDNETTAHAVADEVGIERVIAGVRPDGKDAVIAALREEGRTVVMVGDGINDAPALTRADIGIAVGAGTDVAIESADIVIMKSDLADVATALELSRATMRNIKQNLTFAFIYNIICIPVAAGVLYPAFRLTLDPMLAAAAMSMSSICVVSNALRLRSFGKKKAATRR